MSKLVELKIKNPKNIYQELSHTLCSYKEKPVGSFIFIVEGTKKKPIIGIRYPGRKLKKREGERIKYHWANLYDFEVVPYKNGKELDTRQFTYPELMKDFQNNKKDSQKFWKLLEELYKNNTIVKKSPKLPGIDSQLYLLTLKWMWIQEDFNYRLSWEEVDSPEKYCLLNKNGKPTRRGAGRAKSFAALILIKYFNHYFNLEQINKIIGFQ